MNTKMRTELSDEEWWYRLFSIAAIISLPIWIGPLLVLVGAFWVLSECAKRRGNPRQRHRPVHSFRFWKDLLGKVA